MKSIQEILRLTKHGRHNFYSDCDINFSRYSHLEFEVPRKRNAHSTLYAIRSGSAPYESQFRNAYSRIRLQLSPMPPPTKPVCVSARNRERARQHTGGKRDLKRDRKTKIIYDSKEWNIINFTIKNNGCAIIAAPPPVLRFVR